MEIGYAAGPWETSFAVTNGNGGVADNNAEKRLSFSGSYRANNWRLGIWLNQNETNNGDRLITGVYAGLRTGIVSWLAEYDRIEDDIPGFGDIDQTSGFLEANIAVAKGHNLKLSLDLQTTDIGEDFMRHSVQWEYSPIQFTQLRFGYRKWDGDAVGVFQNADLWFAELQGEPVEMQVFMSPGTLIEVIERDPEDVKVFFYPDNRSDNVYLNLMYAGFPTDWSIAPGDILQAIEYATQNVTSTVVFHLHWTAPVLGPAQNSQEAEALRSGFLQSIATFVDLGGRFVWTIHNVLPHNDKHREVEIELRQGLAALATLIHVHSTKAIEHISPHYDLPADKLIVIPHGNYVGAYYDRFDRTASREKLGYKDEFVFLFLGQLRPYKGLDRLLLAFSQLYSELPSSRLVLAGKPVHPVRPGRLTHQVSLVQGISVFEGFVPDDELHGYFNAADFFVAPYEDVLTSGSILNSLSFGTPVIAPSIGMIPEIITDAQNGFLYDKGSTKGLIDALRRAANCGDQDLDRMNKAALQSVSHLDWGTIGRRFGSAISQSHVAQFVPTDHESGTVISQANMQLRYRNQADSVVAVVLNFDCLDDTRRAVQSLEQSEHLEFDIVVVDNASPGLSFDRLRNCFSDHSVIQAPSNLGYAAGNNIVLQILEDQGHEYVWILNPDTLVPSNTLPELIRQMRKYKKVGVATPAVLFDHRPDTVWFAGAQISFEHGLARIRHRYASWSRNEPDLVKSSALMIISSCRHGLRAPIAA